MTLMLAKMLATSSRSLSSWLRHSIIQYQSNNKLLSPQDPFEDMMYNGQVVKVNVTTTDIVH